MGIESAKCAVKRNQQRWLSHVLQKTDDNWTKRKVLFEVEGVRGRPRITCNQVAGMDELEKTVRESHWPNHAQAGKRAIKFVEGLQKTQ